MEHNYELFEKLIGIKFLNTAGSKISGKAFIEFVLMLISLLHLPKIMSPTPLAKNIPPLILFCPPLAKNGSPFNFT